MTTAQKVGIHPSNTAQAAAWDGDEGEFWAANAERFDAAVVPHHRALFDAAAIAPTERVLDIGCGTGQTTRDAARAAASGAAVGIDLSSQMIDVARQTAAREGVRNATFVCGDAQVHPFEAGGFDVAISRTGAMFFGDAVAAFANIGRGLRSGGRVTLVAWKSLAENEWVREISGALASWREAPPPPPDAPGPFSFADPERVRRVLGDAGFADVTLEDLHAPMWFGPDVDDAFAFVLGVSGWMLDGADDRTRASALDALRASIAAHETGRGVVFDSAAWIIGAGKATR